MKTMGMKSFFKETVEGPPAPRKRVSWPLQFWSCDSRVRKASLGGRNLWEQGTSWELASRPMVLKHPGTSEWPGTDWGQV